MPSSVTNGRRVRGHLHNVAPSAFVQLIAIERETCALDLVTDEGASGRLTFVEGVLWEAAVGKKNGEAAAIEILAWDLADIETRTLDEPAQRRIEAPLTFLLLEAMRLKDEHGAALPSPGHPPGTPLAGLLGERGVVGAYLIDIPTGTLLEEHLLLAADEDVRNLGRSSHELAQAALSMAGSLTLQSPLEELLLTFGRLMLILRFVGANLLLVLVADPAQIKLPAIYAMLRSLNVEELSPWQD